MRIKFQNTQSLWYIKSQKAAQTYINVIISHTAGERLNSLPHRSTVLKLPCFWYHLIWLCSFSYTFTCEDTHCDKQGKKKKGIQVFSQHFLFQNSASIVIQYPNWTSLILQSKKKGQGREEGEEERGSTMPTPEKSARSVHSWGVSVSS